MLSECVRNILLKVLKLFIQLSMSRTTPTTAFLLLFNLNPLHILSKLCQCGTIHELFEHFEAIFDLILNLIQLLLGVLEVRGGAARGFIIMAGSSKLEGRLGGFSEGALEVVIWCCRVDNDFT